MWGTRIMGGSIIAVLPDARSCQPYGKHLLIARYGKLLKKLAHVTNWCMLDFRNDLPHNRFVGRARKHSMDDHILSPNRFAVPRLQCNHCAGSLISHSQTWAGRLSLPTLPASLQPLYRDDLLRQQPRPASARLVVTRYLQRRTIHRACPGT